MGARPALAQAAASFARCDRRFPGNDSVLGFFIEPNLLVFREQTIEIENWPQQLDGLRIAVISDIHVGGSFITDEKLRTIVDRTNQRQPELIVILGDYMTKAHIEPAAFGAILKDFSAPLGTYSVLGNHDWWYDGE